MPKARAPFTEADIANFKRLQGECKRARREIDRAERVGLNVDRYRQELDDAEKKLALVIHEYGDEARP